MKERLINLNEKMRKLHDESKAAFAENCRDENFCIYPHCEDRENICGEEIPDFDEIAEILLFADMVNRREGKKRRNKKNCIISVCSILAAAVAVTAAVFVKKNRKGKKGIGRSRERGRNG